MHDINVDFKNDSLENLVQEAFIDPIRSVLIIDDMYPTWENIFEEENYDRDDNTKWVEKDKILKVIKQFREKSPSLIVDIHDGQNNDSIGSYLHQSDLLVLDFHLESVAPFGAKAAEILRSLLNNAQFNLVVVHTDTTDLIAPFNSILMSLLPPLISDQDRIARGQIIIEDAESNVSEDIQIRLAESLTQSGYLEYRRAAESGTTSRKFIANEASAETFRAICTEAQWHPRDISVMWDWTVSRHEPNMRDNEKYATNIKWKSPGQTPSPWIRTSGGFVAFADKRNTEILDILRSALEDWKPSPSRMISSRIRAEISSLGVIAEDATFSDQRAQWKFYQELLQYCASSEAAKIQRKTLIGAHAARHTERLLDHVGKQAIEFGLRVVQCDPQTSDPNALGFSSHYDLPALAQDEKDVSSYHYNAYISTKPVSGWHLQPGHIISDDGEYWVCVSPACDLVPGQKGQVGILGAFESGTKPFMAVRLHKRTKMVKPADVNSNSIIFLRNMSTQSVDAFGIYPSDGEYGSPVWRLMLAGNNGKFVIGDDNTADITLHDITGQSGNLTVVQKQARIIYQLRYEYALNLVNKLGIEFTRVGLDFVPPPKEDEDALKRFVTAVLQKFKPAAPHAT